MKVIIEREHSESQILMAAINTFGADHQGKTAAARDV